MLKSIKSAVPYIHYFASMFAMVILIAMYEAAGGGLWQRVAYCFASCYIVYAMAQHAGKWAGKGMKPQTEVDQAPEAS